MNKYRGKLSFEGYETEKINVEKLKSAKEDDSKIGFMFKIVPDNKTEILKANVFQGVLIETTGDKKYRIEVVIKGNFKVEDINYEERERYLKANASAILFPYLRSLVSLITSQLECETIILPTMNFHLFFEDTNSEDIFMSEDNFEDF